MVKKGERKMPVFVSLKDKFVEKAVIKELEKNEIEALDFSIQDISDTSIVLMHVQTKEDLERIKSLRNQNPKFVLISIIPYKEPALKKSVIDYGADDVIEEPIDFDELSVRLSFITSAEEINGGYSPGRLDKFNDMIKKTVKRTREEWSFSLELLKKMDEISSLRDDETRDHTQRVGRISEMIAETRMSPDETLDIRLAAPLHDIGKIGIPDSILFKNGPLTDEEYEIMKTHTKMGAKLLESNFEILKCAQKIAMYHHERYDGSGYPEGLSDKEIPIEARIVTIADSFDAMVSKRPYKDARSFSYAIGELVKNAGKQFDPELVNEFKSMLYAVQRLYKDFQ